MISRDKLKAFLDDLALISAKHGLVIKTSRHAEWGLVEARNDFGGYYCEQDGWLAGTGSKELYELCGDGGEIRSLDVSTITAHQRIALAKALAQLREIAG